MIKWLNKIDLLILLAIMAVMIFAVLMLYGFNNGKFTFLNNKTQKQNLNQEIKEEEIKRTDYTDVARKTLDWIDRQRNEEGWYILERGCDYEKKTCDVVWDNKEGNKDGLIATWTRLNFYEQHKDPKDLEIVKKDIDIFYDKYKNDNLKDSLWICKITYEMAQSKYIDQGQKNKLKELCFNVEYPSPEEVKKYWFTERDKKLEKMVGDKQWGYWDIYGIVLRGFDVSLGYTTDLLFRNKWQEGKSDLNSAKDMFRVVKEIYEYNINDNYLRPKIRYPEDICLTMLSAIDIYKLDNNKDMLVFVDNIYKQTLANSENIVNFQTTICGMVTKSMYKLTGNVQYLIDLERNNRVIGNLNCDGNNNKILNDGSFFKSDGKNKQIPHKNVVENGLIVESLRN